MYPFGPTQPMSCVRAFLVTLSLFFAAQGTSIQSARLSPIGLFSARPTPPNHPHSCLLLVSRHSGDSHFEATVSHWFTLVPELDSGHCKVPGMCPTGDAVMGGFGHHLGTRRCALYRSRPRKVVSPPGLVRHADPYDESCPPPRHPQPRDFYGL
ncbi:hypothetical protein V8F20_000278 [Naviculisporaceae sp. PSN 640]